MTSTRPAIPFSPTHHKGYPTSCHLCGRHGSGIGLGTLKSDPKYVCQGCWPMIEYVRSIRSFNGYERAAVAAAVEAIGPFLEAHGTDLSEWEGDTAEEFVRAIWLACGDSLRDVIKEGTVPF